MALIPQVTPLPAFPDRRNASGDNYTDAAADWADTLTNTTVPEMNALATGTVDAAADTFPVGTSTTSQTIGVGTKTFPAQSSLANKQFVPTQDVVIGSAASPATARMFGQITNYIRSTGEMTVEVEEAFGTGDRADWIISLSGPRGEQGASGTLPSLAGKPRYSLRITDDASDIEWVQEGWEEILAITLNNDADATFLSIPQHYSDLAAIFSAQTGASATLRLAHSDDGVSFSSPIAISGSTGSTASKTGSVTFPAYTEEYGFFQSAGTASAPSNNTSGTATTAFQARRNTNGVQALRFTASSGNLILGTIKLIGKL